MESEGSRRCFVVLVPAPFQGHLTPMLQLGTILQSRGFSIIVAHTEYSSPNPLNHPEFIFSSLQDNMSGYEIHEDPPSFIKTMNNNCKAPLQDYLTRMIEKMESEVGQIVCIIRDCVMYFADDVGTRLKLPSIVFHFNAAFLRPYHIISRLQAEDRLPVPESELDESVPEFETLRFKDMPFLLTSKVPESALQFLNNTSSAGSSVAVIFDTADELEHSILTHLRQQNKIPFFSIGPLHKIAPPSETSLMEEDHSCIAWLDQKTPNSVLYVSMGSAALLDKETVEEMAWGLAKSEQSFLWAIRPGSIPGWNWIEQLPQGFVESMGQRGKIVKWAPQRKVLAHFAVGGFWSHCGWNSTMESISQGVPMICTPYFGDQKMNAGYLTHVWKVGLDLELPLRRDTIAKAIRGLMETVEESKGLRKEALIMKQKLEMTIQPGGSSYNSLNDLVEFISQLG